MNEILTKINDTMYTYILLVLLVGAGVYFTIRTKGVQFYLLPDAIKCMLEKSQSKENVKTKMSSFQALMISTASRVGTGNIAGIATAIASGGPGAVFWMWLMALIGGASAFVESTLAQIFKIEDNGSFRGGPSYYMEKALGKRWLGILFSISLILCFGYGFNGLQAFNISSALEYYVPNYAHTNLPMIVGLIIALATAAVIWGGGKRIGFISSVIVPIMAGIYILLGLYIMLANMKDLPDVFLLILKDAFDFRSFAGGIAGSCIVIGVKRGLFSNEAGMGSAPNASASAEVDHPVKQGLAQIISVFIDTLLICSSTAMMLLLSGIQGEVGVLDGIPYVQAALHASVGEWGIHFITLSIFAFAFSSVIGNYYYAESNVLFIKNNKILLNLFRCSCVVVVFLGAQADFSLMWNLADITMGVMAIINILVILLLGGIAFRALEHYKMHRKKRHEHMTFRGSDIGVKHTIWK